MGGRIERGVVMAAGVREAGIFKLQLLRALVHQGHECLLTPGSVIREGPGCIICRGDEHGPEEVADREALPPPQTDPAPGFSGCPLADRDHLVKLTLFQDHQRRHHLGETCRGQTQVGIPLQEGVTVYLYQV